MRAPETDLAVIGGGIIGLGVAYEASRRGMRVTVASHPREGEATPVAGGMIAHAFEAEGAVPVLAELSRRSAALYPEFVAELEHHARLPCHLRSEGTLSVALHRDHVAELEHLARRQEAVGLRAEWLGPESVRAREPLLSPRVFGGLWAADERSVDPRALARALLAAAQRLGATILEAEAVGLDEEAGRVTGVHLRRGPEEVRVQADATVLAAGAWSGAGIEGVLPLPLRPVRGQSVRLRARSERSHVRDGALPGLTIRSPDVYLVPRGDGELVVGASSGERGFDCTPDAGTVLDLLRHAAAVLPAVHELDFVDTGVGLRPTLPDHLPAIGPAHRPGLYVATGHYRHGVALMPITARLLVDAIALGDVAPVAPFAPTRFAERGPSR